MDNEVVYLYLDDIIPNRFQPREVFDDQALKELAISIKEHGVIQPIIVRKVENKYEIIAGERRYKASTMAGLTKIPAIVKNLDDKESSKIALIENLQRRDLTPIEEARTYQKILELEPGMTQEQLAATMGKTQSVVSNKLRLLALPDEIQDALLKEKISERHARSLLNLVNKNDQIKMLDKVIAERMTVRELDKEIKEMNDNQGQNSENSNLINTIGNINNNSNSVINSNLNNNSVGINSDVNNPFNINNPFKSIPSTNGLLDSNNTINSNQVNSFVSDKNSLNSNINNNGFINNSISNNNNFNNNVSRNNNINGIPPMQSTNTSVGQSNLINPTTVDINKIRENAMDINKQNTSPVNVKDLMRDTSSNSNFKFVPNENSNVNNNSFVPNNNQSSFLNNSSTQKENTNGSGSIINLFKEVSKMPVNNLNTVNNTSSVPTFNLNAFNNSNKKDVMPAINDIKSTVKNIENKGYKVLIEENDTDNSYQIVIKVDKNI